MSNSENQKKLITFPCSFPGGCPENVTCYDNTIPNIQINIFRTQFGQNRKRAKTAIPLLVGKKPKNVTVYLTCPKGHVRPYRITKEY